LFSNVNHVLSLQDMTKTITLSDKDAERLQLLIEVMLDSGEYSGDDESYELERVKDNVWEQITGKKRE
jgi:hypothetical protein